MKILTFLLTITLLVSMIPPVSAQTVKVLKDTVIPVTLLSNLSSATNNVGDKFKSSCTGSNCGGFPSGTMFLGNITEVVKASEGTPGQIDVFFYQAILPGNRGITINGGLSSLDTNEVYTDPATGRLVMRPQEKDERNKFIAYGAGTGALIGVIGSHKKTQGTIEGALIGAAAGWLTGTAVGPKTEYSDVNLPAGTEFGIVMLDDLILTKGTPPGGSASPGKPAPPGTTPGGTGTGPVPVLTVTYSALQPFRGPNDVLMVPFRETMTDLNLPYSYRPATHTLFVDVSRGEIRHTIGTSIVFLGNVTARLSAPSQLINGSTFVPVDFVTLVTDRNAMWDPGNRTLILR